MSLRVRRDKERRAYIEVEVASARLANGGEVGLIEESNVPTEACWQISAGCRRLGSSRFSRLVTVLGAGRALSGVVSGQ